MAVRKSTANYDIIVAGGGIAGSFAAASAAREGAKVLLVEAGGCLGGTLTLSSVPSIMDEIGKGGIHYGFREGIALETQFYPDAVHHPEWPQPILKAGQHYHSETTYSFSW